jgi:hypothetical protein
MIPPPRARAFRTRVPPISISTLSYFCSSKILHFEYAKILDWVGVGIREKENFWVAVRLWCMWVYQRGVMVRLRGAIETKFGNKTL